MRISWYKRLFWNLIIIAFVPVFLIAAIFPGRRHDLLIWGPEPGIGNKYWSKAMKQAGHKSVSLMSDRYAINAPEDFDKYYVDFVPLPLPKSLRWALGSCLAFIYALRRGKVVHGSFWGFSLGLSGLWWIESFFFRLSGTKFVVIGFGGDIYLYSKVSDPSLRYGLLASYPHFALEEEKTVTRIRYWVRNADIILCGYMMDGIGRWDVTTHSVYAVDTDHWTPKSDYSDHDGTNGVVRLLHAPNHRGFKGTEFIIQAVEELKAQGLKVELVLLEGIPNSQVREVMKGVDFLLDQCIMTGYALNSMEGMASGLPVLANMSEEYYTRVFRRYGFLDECPILSTTPENIRENIRVMVENPQLRKRLGMASRDFVVKYHSLYSTQYLFGSIYDHLFSEKKVDLLNLFHPLKSEYNLRTPRVEHPLIESTLPRNFAGGSTC
ncbi:glycosyltransferase family 4 protein [Sphingorhabdus soli]|uniref:Glycosyltransferase family 4 protein n=1 Tax=Flavisphingopyxis soli TaxID=2601267 RepID=A0A5C6ULT2_9SPHN|nr:glycosyltransferase family 4 protein [Sphingorhabdus soli]TXC74242.1 glycosyltransferase family 4 protein [Sphingorhabdus soli]